MSERPKQDQDKYVLRLPNGMRDRLKALASDNKRSLNAEIIARLEETLQVERMTQTLVQLDGVYDLDDRVEIINRAGVDRKELDGLVRAILTLPARIEVLEARVGVGDTEDAADAATFDQRIAEAPPGQLSTEHLGRRSKAIKGKAGS